MANDRKKFQKKKDRERTVAQKLRTKRDILKKEREAEQAKQAAFEKQVDPNMGAKQVPFMKEETKEAMIKRRLEHNMKILEALEQEYLAEQTRRRANNEALENEGHFSMREKMDALHKQALTQLEKQGVDIDNVSIEKETEISVIGS